MIEVWCKLVYDSIKIMASVGLEDLEGVLVLSYFGGFDILPLLFLCLQVFTFSDLPH